MHSRSHRARRRPLVSSRDPSAEGVREVGHVRLRRQLETSPPRLARLERKACLETRSWRHGSRCGGLRPHSHPAFDSTTFDGACMHHHPRTKVLVTGPRDNVRRLRALRPRPPRVRPGVMRRSATPPLES
jgi:hypothetical protein